MSTLAILKPELKREWRFGCFEYESTHNDNPPLIGTSLLR